jgi:PAS domain S-box-containing protein
MAHVLRLLPRSLVGRVFALYTVVLLTFVVSGLAAFYRYQFTVEVEDSQERAEALTAMLQPSVSDSAVIGDYDTIHRMLERALHQSAFASAAFIDLRGGVVQAENQRKPDVVPPVLLTAAFAQRLYDSNQPISVGGRDYGVLRLRFAHERIAGGLWEQTRMALALGLAAVVAGLVLIRFPLVHWLGNLNRIKSFEVAMESGELDPSLLAAQEAPSEFRDTFEVLGRAAATLQAQRAQAAVTLGAIADGVLTLDTLGRVLLANPAACAMAGRPLQALQGKTLRQIVPHLTQDMPAGPLKPWTNLRVTVSGGERPVILDTTLSPIRTPDGATAGYVLACRDISEQHQLDQRLRAELTSRESALVALRQVLESLPSVGSAGSVDGAGRAVCVTTGSDDLAAISMMISELVQRLQMRGEQLDAIFALSADGFVSFDAQRHANYVSPAFTRLTGLPATRVLGSSDADIEALLRAQCRNGSSWRGLAALREAAQGGLASASTNVEPEQIELLRPMRRVLEVALRLGTTEAISQVLSLRDVTHESEVDQMKSEFLSTAAHEMRTPMASIFGFVELMLHRPLSPERQRDVLETVHRQSLLMINIVNELLDLARIEARRGSDFVLETVDLADLVRDVLHDFNPPQERAEPQLETQTLATTVSVDLNKMRQALSNVLSNAYKYSPGGGAVSVRLVGGPPAAAGLPPTVGVEVRDSGIGMTAEQLARVSERFYRADASGSIPGTGLGMSIVKEITELLGGRLALASVPGEGTAVTLWLPTAGAAAPTPAATATTATAGESTYPASPASPEAPALSPSLETA